MECGAPREKKECVPDDHVMVSAVRLATGVCRCDGKGSSNVTQVRGDCVVWHTDHYAVLGAYAVIGWAHT